MLYHKRTRSVIKWVWGFFALLIAISMIFAYSGGAGVFGGGGSHQQVPPVQNTAPAVQQPTHTPDGTRLPAEGETIENVVLPDPINTQTESEVPFEISL